MKGDQVALFAGAIFTPLSLGMLWVTKSGNTAVTFGVLWSPLVMLVGGNSALSCPQLLTNFFAEKKRRVRDGLWGPRFIGAIFAGAGLLFWLNGWETSELGHGLNVALNWLLVMVGEFILIRPRTLEPKHPPAVVAGMILPCGHSWKKR